MEGRKLGQEVAKTTTRLEQKKGGGGTIGRFEGMTKEHGIA